MDQNDRDQFCTFFRHSGYDVILAREGDGWGPVFTFLPCNVRAAQKAAQMMVRMHQGEQPRVRHARLARLHDRHRHVEKFVVVVTDLPEREQTVLNLHDALTLRVDVYLTDFCLTAIEAAVAPAPDQEPQVD